MCWTALGPLCIRCLWLRGRPATSLVFLSMVMRPRIVVNDTLQSLVNRDIAILFSSAWWMTLCCASLVKVWKRWLILLLDNLHIITRPHASL